MSGAASGLASASREREALAAIRTLRGRLDEALQARSEPIAIIGLSCRFPGAVTDPASYWNLLSNGKDGVRPIPPERIDLEPIFDAHRDVPGKTYSRWAGMVEDVDGFDADFFGISPREAALTDPQQRLFLEGSWLALEHAGIAPTSLGSSLTGVFVGVTTMEYARLHDRIVAHEDISSYFIQGLSANTVAGRVSYTLGLQGPSLSIDTACSSSLVAVDRACRSLREEECHLAISGGVNVLIAPEALIAGSRLGMFAPDGRCKSFSALADGFVRGEGCGVVVLKRLRDAAAAGDRVLAVIRGSAVNHDGPSSGLTVPNGLAQQALMRRALKAAGVAPAEVGYVEAHGTGTSLGDPIEAEALGAVMGAGRPSDTPLLIGSVKTNIGHLEAAAGVAGLIKVVLALGHGELPGQLHWDAPSPHIRWDALKLRVVDRLRAWKPINGRCIAGVSSFGFSGTNAHVVVEAAPVGAEIAAGLERPLEILPISARSGGALRTLAEGYLDRLQPASAVDWPDLCHTAAVGRAQFGHRLSVRGADAAAGRAALEAFLADQPHPALIKGAARPGGRPRVGFLFTGQGSQYPGMGRALHARSPGFQRIVERAEAALAERLDIPLGAVMRGEHPQAAELLNQTLYTQPALYVLEYALAELWRDLGVEPAVVLGHSLGEYVGCAIAGVFGFEDGLRLVADRARLMQELGSDGAMLVVAASEAEIAGLLAGREAEVSLAGVNAARQVTVSGARRAVEAIAADCAARGWRSHALPVSQAFHSPLMEPIGAAFEGRAGEIAYAPPRLPVISNLTGVPLETVSAAYWRAHMRQAVRFSQGLDALWALGCDVLIEVGPRPVLIQLARQGASSAKVPGAEQPRHRYLTSLKGPGTDEWDALCQAVQELYAAGAELDWAGWNRDYRRRKIDAPSYPFERRRHWISPSVGKPGQVRGRVGGPHPLLGTRLRSALAGGQFDADLAVAGETAWLAEHRIAGQAIMPATGLIEIMLAAGQAIDPHWGVLEVLSILAPLCLPPAGTRTVQTVVDGMQDDGRARVRVFAAEADAAGIEAPSDAQGQLRFRLHAEARLAPARAGGVSASEDLGATADLTALRTRCMRRIEGEEHYRHLAERGADFGPAFRGVRHLWAGEGEAIGEIEVSLPPIAGGRPHPAALDACLQSAAAMFVNSADAFLPVVLDRFECFATSWPQNLVVHARLTTPDPVSPELDFTVHDLDGKILARFHRLRFHNTSTTTISNNLQSWMYETRWRLCAPTPLHTAGNATLRGRWLLMADRHGVAKALAKRIKEVGGTCVLAEPGREYRQIDPSHVELDPRAPGQFRKLLGTSGESGFQGAVDCWPLDLHFDIDQAPAEALAEQAFGYGSALHVIQALVERASPPPLLLVTAGAAPLGEAAGTPTYGTMAALRKTLQVEFPEMVCRVIDLEEVADPTEAAAALAAELERSDEPEVALREQRRFVPRLVSATLAGPAFAKDKLVELVPAASGLIDDLSFVTKQRIAPKPDEVEIKVRATGLNFRDVLNALGMLPGTRRRLGGECAGVIARAGSESTFSPGDQVIAFCPGQSGSFVTVPAGHVARKPEHLDFAQAAGLPIGYLTALYALYRLASLQAGETILIHAAAGGLGSAAMHLALARGARVYATAGSEAKRDHVRALGATAVMSSRTLAFADALLVETGGRGVDVVLNTLNGDFVTASFRALAASGRFIEVGKRGVFTPEQAREHRPDAAFHQFDLGQAAEADETLIPSLLRELTEMIDSGAVPPLPVESVAYAGAKMAFRKMAEARHIGKMVLSHGPAEAGAGMRACGGAYLITGGFGALGLRAAGWLADRGVETILLIGPRVRRPEVIAAIETRGTTVISAEADCADADALRAILSKLPPGQKLRGVIHCAGTLADAILPQQSWASFEHVARPKFGGALALHQATVGQELEAFVLFSSAAAIVGSSGQANYAAANAALHTIARARRARGEVALCVDWGPWTEGMAADDRVSRRNLGLVSIGAQAGFAALDKLLDSQTVQASVLPLSTWSAFFDAHPCESLDPFFAEVRPALIGTHQAGRGEPDIAADLRAMPPQARRRALLDHLREQLARVLGSDPLDPIASATPLQERGLELADVRRTPQPAGEVPAAAAAGNTGARLSLTRCPVRVLPVPAFRHSAKLSSAAGRRRDDRCPVRCRRRGHAAAGT